jgi:hypothetical protein
MDGQTGTKTGGHTFYQRMNEPSDLFIMRTWFEVAPTMRPHERYAAANWIMQMAEAEVSMDKAYSEKEEG